MEGDVAAYLSSDGSEMRGAPVRLVSAAAFWPQRLLAAAALTAAAPGRAA
jgi:hypothetical protein